MDRLNLDRLECNMCLTWSLSSALSSLVQPSSDAPCGKTAKRVSLRVESIVATVARVPFDGMRFTVGAGCAASCASAWREASSNSLIC